MISREEKLRLKMLITDTVLLLCKNGLVPKLRGEFSIEGLIGISLQDEEDLMLVSFKERLKGENIPDPQSFSETDSELDQKEEAKRYKRRKRKHTKHDEGFNKDVSPAKSASLDVDPDTESQHWTADSADINFTATTSLASKHFTGSRANKDSSITTTGFTRASEGNGQLGGHCQVVEDEENGKEGEEYNGPGDVDCEEVNQSKYSVKLESCDDNSDDELILIKQEINNPAMSSETSHLEMGPFVSGTQITGIVANQLSYPSNDTTTRFTSDAQTVGQDSQLQQVELLPGSGVYISLMAYQQLQYIDKGTKLVRKLVREVFPDVHVLANSSCKGRGTSGGLDQHKVEVIKEFARQRHSSTTEAVMLDTINHVCIESRRLIRARAKRSKNQDTEQLFNLPS